MNVTRSLGNLHYCWTASIKQPISPTTWFRTFSLGILPVTKDAFVCRAPRGVEWLLLLHYITLEYVG